MKVALFVGDTLPTGGGGHTYEDGIVTAVGDLRHETRHEVVAVGFGRKPPSGWDAGSYVSLGRPLGARVAARARRDVRRLIGATPDSSRHASAVLRANDVTLVWNPSPETPTFDIPFIATVWDLQHRVQPWFPEVSANGEWERRETHYRALLGRAYAVIVGTEAGAAEVADFYGVPKSRIRFFPHPTPSFALTAVEPPAQASAYPNPFVLYPAQFWPHKNHVNLVRALAIVRDRHHTNLDAVFVGSDKGHEERVRSIAGDLGLERNVHFRGFVSTEELVRLYQQAMMLGYLSYFGPENLPPLEAFALGCPVIAADVAGAGEQLGEAAILVPPSDPSAIADALVKLASNEGRRTELIERGRERAATYTTSHYARAMFAMLDEIEPGVTTWR